MCYHGNNNQKKPLLQQLCCTSLFLPWIPGGSVTTPGASNISQQTSFVIKVNARAAVESSGASALFLSHRGMTNDAKHDLVLLSCDCKRTWFPFDSLTPINSTMPFLKSYLSGPRSASSSTPHQPLSILPPLFPCTYFMFYCRSYKLSHNFLTVLFKGRPPSFLWFFPLPRPLSSLGRPPHPTHPVIHSTGIGNSPQHRLTLRS